MSWERLVPPLDIFPIARSDGLLLSRKKKVPSAKEIFAGTDINITTEGRKQRGAALGSRLYLEQYVGGKVEDRVGEVTSFPL